MLEVLLLLLPFLAAAKGAVCPARAAYIPEHTLGDLPGSSTFKTQNGTQLLWGTDGDFKSECCGSGRIVNWTVATTQEFEYVARVFATCSDGEQISTPLYGTNGTETCPTSIKSAQSLYQSDDEGVFSYQRNAVLTNFLGVGEFSFSLEVSGCPAGLRAIGVGARSSCYAITDLQVVCARTNEDQDNLGGELDVDTSCSASSSMANGTSILDANQGGIVSNGTQTECCPEGEGVANWTIARSDFGTERYIGLIQGRCTDGTLLAPIKYGFNGTGNPVCMQQRLNDGFHLSTPISQEFSYSTSTATDRTSVLSGFMAPPYGRSQDSENDLWVSCPSGQGAVGYSAASSCYSLSNLAIRCGTLSDSANEALEKYGSAEVNPPANADAGVCPGGLTVQPEDYVTSPVGRAGPWSWLFTNGTKADTTAASSLVSTACCPSGQAITAFNVWSSSSDFVGKVSAVCSPNLDGSESNTTSEIAYGFNGTSLDGTAAFCPNTTKAMKSIPLENGNWTHRSGALLDVLMEWPAVSLRGRPGIANASCPAGQTPIGFSARRECWALTDFRVICGKLPVPAPIPAPAPAPVDLPVSAADVVKAVDVTAQASTGLNTAGKAGIAVGIIAVLAFVVLVGGFLFYRRRNNQKRNSSIESVESGQLDKLKEPITSYTSYSGGATSSTLSGDKHRSGATVNSMESGHSTIDSNEVSGWSTKSSHISAVPFSHVLRSSDVINMEDLDLPPPTAATSGSFDNLPVKWQIPLSSVKLLCVGDRPIVLGKGGYGVVYKAIVRKDDAAIKIVTGGGKSEQARLLHEITILEQCKSVNIVQFLGYSISDDGLLLCMEYMSGGTLYSSLGKSKEFQWYRRGWRAAKAIGAGLYCLHEQGVAHLDLKSPNVLIGSDRRVKIADMGLGKLVKGVDTQASQLGTIAWMAPEVLLKGTCALQSDVWSFSTILWEICTLRRPEYALRVDDIKVPEEAPQELVDLIHLCRAENYQERPSIVEICDLLDNIPHAIE